MTAALNAQSPHTILDIRRPTFESSIREQVIDGLSKQPKTLPALLFYNSEGLEHWTRHSQQPEFYPRLQEMQILRKRAHEMATAIAPDSVLVDLGSASLEKATLLLAALEAQKKNITYYALDLSASQLASTLQAIPTADFHHVRISALHGTFEDGLLWLKETPGIRDLPHCMLLFGLTIGNFSRPNAAAFLRNIAAHALGEPHRAADDKRSPSSILLSLDSCKMPTQILRAYTSEGVVPFALAALKYGNTVLAVTSKVFNPDEWYFLSEWNFVLGRHEASLIPRSQDIRLGAPLDGIVVSREEKVRFGCSYKYGDSEREALFAAAGLEDVARWSDEGCDVAFYKLALPTASL